jgi:PAS domain S-box-containing protein
LEKSGLTVDKTAAYIINSKRDLKSNRLYSVSPFFDNTYGVEKYPNNTYFNTVINSLSTGGFLQIQESGLTDRLAEERTLLYSVFEQAAIGICYGSRDGKFFNVNQYFLDMLGYSRPEFKELSWNDIMHPVENKEYLELISGFKTAELDIINVELRFIRKDGATIWGNINVSWIRESSGLREFFVAFIENITKRKNAEEALKKSEIRFRNYFNLPLIGIAIASPEKKWIEVNDCYCEMLGYSADELKSMTWAELTHSDDISEDMKMHDKMLAGEINNYTIDKRYIHKTGKIVWVSMAKGCVRNENNELEYLVISCMDITHRKMMEDELEESKAKLSSVLESTEDMIWAIDSGNHSLIAFNSAFKNHFLNAFNINVFMGMRLDDYLPKNLALKWDEYFETAAKSGSFQLEYYNYTNSKILHLSFNLLKGNEKIFGISIFAKDITEQKKMEEEIKKHHEKLEEMVKERTIELLHTIKKLDDEIIERKKYEESLMENKIILDSIEDGVFTTNEKSIIMSFNKSAEIILGYSAQEVIGKNYFDVFRILEPSIDIEDKTNNGIELINEVVKVLNSSGSSIPVSLSTSILKNNDNTIKGFACTFRDISELENLREEISKDSSFQGMVSKNAEMQKIFAILPDIALSDSTVLIEGPTGTGKNILAKAIHNLSLRKNKPFVLINCGTVPPELVESELFGYVKGAFTDAKHDKSGKISVAEGGTVFFDEIGDMPFSLQVKLLRLIEDRQYEPVGSSKTISADIRIITATNKNLVEQVKNKKFRDDLYYRLSTAGIFLPPLSKRKEDIIILIDHFIKKFNVQKGKNIGGISGEAKQILVNYSYPGNIRELSNIIEYCFITCKSNIISQSNLPVSLAQETVMDNADSAEKENILSILEKNGGNKMKTSKDLNISYVTLWRKLKKYGI